MAPPSSAPTKSSGLEEVIQNKIAANAGLREVLTLQRELEQFELVTRSLSEMQIATQFSPSVASSMKTKASRLRELREQGWSVKSVHNKLNEITVSLLTSLKHFSKGTTLSGILALWPIYYEPRMLLSYLSTLYFFLSNNNNKLTTIINLTTI